MKIVEKINLIPSYLYRNFAAPRFYSIRDKKILERNLELKNKYAGKRCFIIGGGPSVSDIDLSKLSNEYTFVMNDFEKNTQYQSLSPKFHIITDSAFYSEEESKYWTKSFIDKDKSINTNTIMLINIAAKPFMSEHHLFNNHTVYYIGTRGIMTENFPFSIELDRYIPYPKNSMLLSLMSAVYMGFSEIYLLGCEHNYLAYRFNKENPLVNWGHNYEDKKLSNLDLSNTEVLRDIVPERDMTSSYEFGVAHVLQLFKNYRLFYKKVRQTKPNIQIFNATPESYLDVFPFIDYDTVIK